MDLDSNAVLEQACARVGIDAAGARVIRASENVLYRLPRGVVARVGRAGAGAAAEREIKIATWLREHDFPAVRPSEGLAQPQMVDGRPVTFWDEIPAHRQGRMPELGLLLRELHNLPTPREFDPGPLAPLIRVRERIEAAIDIEDRERAWLLAQTESLADDWKELPAGLPACVVHGDAWVGNVAVTEDGTALLLDFERCALGPPEWDLAHSAIKSSSFGWAPGQYAKFVKAYGYDVTDYPGFETLRDIRELRMTSFALQCARENPAYQTEARRRVDCLLGRCGPRPWSGWHPTP